MSYDLKRVRPYSYHRTTGLTKPKSYNYIQDDLVGFCFFNTTIGQLKATEDWGRR